MTFMPRECQDHDLFNTDPVNLPRTREAYFALADVAFDQLRFAVIWVTITATAASAETDDVAGLEFYRRLGAEPALVRAGIQNITGFQAGQAAEQAVRAPAVAVR